MKAASLRIKAKPSGKHGLDRLPFITSRRKSPLSPFWSVPASGLYAGGRQAGEAMATLFLKQLRDADGPLDKYFLGHVITSIAHRYESAGGAAMENLPMGEWTEEFCSIRGQMIGFLDMISLWVDTAVQHFGAPLDHIPEEDLISDANAGLALDQAAYLEFIEASTQAHPPISPRNDLRASL